MAGTKKTFTQSQAEDFPTQNKRNSQPCSTLPSFGCRRPLPLFHALHTADYHPPSLEQNRRGDGNDALATHAPVTMPLGILPGHSKYSKRPANAEDATSYSLYKLSMTHHSLVSSESSSRVGPPSEKARVMTYLFTRIRLISPISQSVPVRACPASRGRPARN